MSLGRFWETLEKEGMVCCGPWGYEDLGMILRLNSNKIVGGAVASLLGYVTSLLGILSSCWMQLFLAAIAKDEVGLLRISLSFISLHTFL